MKKRRFYIEGLTKVEGHAKLDVEMEGNKIKTTKLEVYEASRYFEAMVRGRSYSEIHSISQRICGICSVVHTTAALKAIEKALGAELSQQASDLRKMMLYASHIHSHAAHLFFFALPDYAGFKDAIEMSMKRKEYMRLGMDLQRSSSDAVRIIGGRAIHPVTPKVGGFHSFPDKGKMRMLEQNFRETIKLASKAAKIFSSLKYPELKSGNMQFALKNGGEYLLHEGTITSDNGNSFGVDDYGKNITEEIRAYSNAKYSTFKGKEYMVGALPRVNMNYRNLTKSAKSVLRDGGFAPPVRNPFMNNLAQAAEMVHFAEKALEISERYPDGMRDETVKIRPKQGEGIGVCEAPRGILIHHYVLGNDGKITKANIITPTSQNAGSMEKDVKAYLPSIIKYSDEKVKQKLEMLIRAYDPCFSCSTHFLNLRLKR